MFQRKSNPTYADVVSILSLAETIVNNIDSPIFSKHLLLCPIYSAREFLEAYPDDPQVLEQTYNYIANSIESILKAPFHSPEGKTKYALLASNFNSAEEETKSDTLEHKNPAVDPNKANPEVSHNPNKDDKEIALHSAIDAMFRGDQEKLTQILNSDPECIFVKLEGTFQSPLTHLKYQITGETLFSMAQQLAPKGHIDVQIVEAMLPHYSKKLEDARTRKDKSAITELEKAWIMRVPTEDEQKKLREKYTNDFIRPVIRALKADTSINLTEERNPKTGVNEAKIYHPSQDTRKAFDTFIKKLFEPKTLKDCIDVNQFLIALYDAYINFDTSFTFNDFVDDLFERQKTLDGEHAYILFCIGIGQSMLGHGLAELCCRGLNPGFENHEKAKVRARTLVIEDGRPFYRDHSGSSGVGSSYVCHISNGMAFNGLVSNKSIHNNRDWFYCALHYFRKYVADMLQSISNLKPPQKPAVVLPYRDTVNNLNDWDPLDEQEKPARDKARDEEEKTLAKEQEKRAREWLIAEARADAKKAQENPPALQDPSKNQSKLFQFNLFKREEPKPNRPIANEEKETNPGDNAASFDDSFRFLNRDLY